MGGMFEVLEFIEHRDDPGLPVDERVIGIFDEEHLAVESGRTARNEFLQTKSEDYAWWLVRLPGERLARWIADSHSDREFMLDLTTGQLIEVP